MSSLIYTDKDKLSEYETIDLESPATTFKQLWNENYKDQSFQTTRERSQTTPNAIMERLSDSNQADMEFVVKTEPLIELPPNVKLTNSLCPVDHRNETQSDFIIEEP
ncbi:hypothetical protein BOTCAL_0213g00100 [Botryotinia calthae]|uniref:Uncharacterized protein n=1 Tax=Botryotinia calthae TaxID=38488 RepID=A0A4Y8D1A7_9HELO|nr:hypothetical protein BOTCAL_0213g00100 [Botryotinia calthae]